MYRAGAKNDQAISCLIAPDAFPEVDRMCRSTHHPLHPRPPWAGSAVSGTIVREGRPRDGRSCEPQAVMVKIGAFYALGKKKAPTPTSATSIQALVNGVRPERCM